jgi:hypothetical protein
MGAGEEIELGHTQTALIEGSKAKLGRAVVTSERLLFVDTKFAAGVGGLIGAAIVDELQRRHEDGGPMLDVPLTSITAVRREKKLLNKDRIAITTAEREYLLNDGWRELGPKLREALTGRGLQVTDAGPDSWRVG